MKRFKEYTNLDLTAVADEILAYWKTNDIFEKSISEREGQKPFVFFEGPPSANGLPGIHHVIGRTVKDLFLRYKTMSGHQVKRKAGWDTHGLPVELGVEKALGITKEDIGKKISIEAYNSACKEAVMRYTDTWNDLTEKIGYWVAMDTPYITYTPKYMESVWWLLKQLFDKKLLYKGDSIQPFSPKAGTGLSTHEINQPGAYQDITDTTIIAQFKTVAESLPTALKPYAKNLYLLAWTTTPWTLPSNTALTVGKKIDYVVVETFNQYTKKPIVVILAKVLLEKCFGKAYIAVTAENFPTDWDTASKQIPYVIRENLKGKDLLEIRYEQLMPYVKPYKNVENAFRVIVGDFVTTEDGTGIVHTAPTFGADDALVAKKATPPVPPMLVLDDDQNPVPLVTLQGRFRKEVGPYAHKYVKNEYYETGKAPEKSVDIDIAIELKTDNKAFHVAKYKHSYPHCWRTDKPILYYPLNSWFVRVSEYRDDLFKHHQTINWKPKSTGEGRFGNWLQNANDWNLSRSRYWGIPLPIWRDETGKYAICIGRVAQLKDEIKKSIKAGLMQKDPFENFDPTDMSDENYANIDLHKNIVDKIILVSEKGTAMHREADLIDVWFDSGAMPYAQWHYPFENKDLIDHQKSYPADFIAEGVDQTRGWFYTLHVISSLVFEKVAYKNVVSNGLVLDKNGKKMSKRLGNAIDPFTTIKTYGVDATRWYMIGNANPWDNLRFDLEGVEEVRRKFFGTLYNTYAFFALYANLDRFDTAKKAVPIKDRTELDRWILSELHTLIEKVAKFYEDYEPTKVVRAVQHFVTEDLSNWFVRLSRRRFWKSESATDKTMAYQTLYECLCTVSKLAAPIAPFFMDRLYQDLTNETSVHLADFPTVEKTNIDAPLERRMQKAQKIASMALSLRKKEKIKVKQPLKRIIVPIINTKEKTDLKAVSDLVCKEINVKKLEILENNDTLVKKIQPNFKVLGPRFGKDMKNVAQAIEKMTQENISTLEKKGVITIEITGKKIDIHKNETVISFEDIKGWVVTSQTGLTVALDITIDEGLKQEGITRELINRIQNIRKEIGLSVTDKINLQIAKNEALEMSVKAYENHLKTETLTEKISFVKEIKAGIEVAFDGIKTNIKIEKMKNYYTSEELEEFKKIITEKLETAEKQLDYLRNSYRNGSDNRINDTSFVFKSSPEAGAEDLEKETNTKLAIRQEKFIRDLKNALLRIENKTYGICIETGELISKERLLIVPHATSTIEAKTKK